LRTRFLIFQRLNPTGQIPVVPSGVSRAGRWIDSWDEVAKLLQEAELRKLEKHLKVGEEGGDD
jgi:hypothetical protein